MFLQFSQHKVMTSDFTVKLYYANNLIKNPDFLFIYLF